VGNISFTASDVFPVTVVFFYRLLNYELVVMPNQNNKKTKRSPLFRSIALFAFLFYSQFLPAQEIAEAKYFEVITDLPVVRCNISGQTISDSILIPVARSRFALIGTYGDSVIIRFVNWDNNTERMERNNFGVVVFGQGTDTIKRNEYFKMKKTDLDANCYQIHGKNLSTAQLTVGFVTMPLKLRLGKNFEFEPTISLGATAGLKMRISKHYPNYFNLLFGASTATVTIDSFSTRGRATQPVDNILVFSPSIGAVLQFGKSQIGLFGGIDLLGKSNNTRYDWIYQKKPWLTVGFGFSIFSLEEKSAKNKSD
jgi:hypothetical protein